MAITPDPVDGLTEYCAACDGRTIHQVSIQMRTENADSENSEFSREPYRVTECQRCGTRSSQRMNSA